MLGEQETRHHLRVKCLGASHGHLNITPVGRIDHEIADRRQRRVPSIDDSEDRRAASKRQLRGPIGVSRGPRLTDRHNARIAQVGEQPVGTELAGGYRRGSETSWANVFINKVCTRQSSYMGRTLPDEDEAPEL